MTNAQKCSKCGEIRQFTDKSGVCGACHWDELMAAIRKELKPILDFLNRLALRIGLGGRQS